ncbi:hypothetical protein BU17DRAFT_62167 [Hysterangium stoloniferum]|nr:hypothetical protein BU17DRAFT_62167 [Hysterangium stoloniferum]
MHTLLNKNLSTAMADGMLLMLGRSSADGNHGGHFGHVLHTPADGNNLVGFDSELARESVGDHLLAPAAIPTYTRPLPSGSDPLVDFHNPPLAGLDRPGPIDQCTDHLVQYIFILIQSSQNGDSLRIPVFDTKGSLIGPHHSPTLNLSRVGLNHDQNICQVRLRDAKTTGLVLVPDHVSQKLVVGQVLHVATIWM